MKMKRQKFSDINVGDRACRTVEISPQLIDDFAQLSGDFSSIHMDPVAAREMGFNTRVAHGALLTALVSSILGMELPGRSGVVHSFEMAFKRPCYVDTVITVSVEVLEKFSSVATLTLSVSIVDESSRLLAKGKVQSGLKIDG